MNFLFGVGGRLSRGGFLLGVIVWGLLVVTLSFGVAALWVSTVVVTEAEAQLGFVGAVMLGAVALGLWSLVSLFVKRGQDAGWPMVVSLVLAAGPFVGIALYLHLWLPGLFSSVASGHVVPEVFDPAAQLPAHEAPLIVVLVGAAMAWLVILLLTYLVIPGSKGSNRYGERPGSAAAAERDQQLAALIDGLVARAAYSTGEVAGLKTWSTTHVSGYGGANNTNVSISSSTTTWTQLFIRENSGREQDLKFPRTFEVREGHTVSFASLNGTWVAYAARETEKGFYFPKDLKHALRREKIPFGKKKAVVDAVGSRLISEAERQVAAEAKQNG